MRRAALPALVIAVVLVAASCGDDGPTRDSDGAITEPGDISTLDLREGDCFDLPADVESTVERVRALPCPDPHDHEVYLALVLADGPFPGAPSMAEEAEDRCLEAFEPFVGADYFESGLELFSIRPTPESWEDGDRTVYCVLGSRDGSKLTGTMRGSGR
jgi:hypothetical protein